MTLDRLPFLPLIAALLVLVALSVPDVLTALSNVTFLWEYLK